MVEVQMEYLGVFVHTEISKNEYTVFCNINGTSRLFGKRNVFLNTIPSILCNVTNNHKRLIANNSCSFIVYTKNSICRGSHTNYSDPTKLVLYRFSFLFVLYVTALAVLCRPGWLQTKSIPPASVSWVLGLKPPGLAWFSFLKEGRAGKMAQWLRAISALP